jgi:hypothetical protein
MGGIDIRTMSPYDDKGRDSRKSVVDATKEDPWLIVK